jgi:serine/threonine protein kinase
VLTYTVTQDNILVNLEGNIKITDFGLTIHVNTTGGHTGQTGGSERWMSPELLSFNGPLSEWKPTNKADVYSFAHTIVEVFAIVRSYCFEYY